MQQLGDYGKNYDLVGMCSLEVPESARVKIQLTLKPAPTRFKYVQTLSLQIIDELEAFQTDMSSFCSTFDTESLKQASDHLTKITSLSNLGTEEMQAINAELR
jgi:hypothetical protein